MEHSSMESPAKKRKSSSISHTVGVQSTPRITGTTIHKMLNSFSSIERGENLFSYQNDQSPSSSLPDDMSQLLSVTSSFDNMDFQEDEDSDDEIDYQAFLQSCKRIQNKGIIWELYKPFREDSVASLYGQILSKPRDGQDLALWFAEYCKNKSLAMATYGLFQFFFDCGGFQKFHLKDNFSFPPNVHHIIQLVNNVDVINEFGSKRYLFAENAKLAKIYQYGIFVFLQSFFGEAYNQDIIECPIIEMFLSLLIEMCKKSIYRPLVHTAYLFVFKILTSLCRIKELPHQRNENKSFIDKYITIIYVNFSKICIIADRNLAKLKISGLSELKVWIKKFPTIFTDHYDCTEVVRQLIIDECPSVRLAAVNFISYVCQSEFFIKLNRQRFVQKSSLLVQARFYDTDKKVAVSALEVFNYLVIHHWNSIPKQDVLVNIIEIIYHKDYRMGSAAGKCLIDIFNNDDQTKSQVLTQLCKVASSFHPNLKPLLVESCFDHSDIFRSWDVYLDMMMDVSKPISVAMEDVSSLFLESVTLALTGRTSKTRFSVNLDRSVQSDQHQLVASEIYPRIKRLIVLYKTKDAVLQDLFSVLTKINPQYMTAENCEVCAHILKHFISFFKCWNDPQTISIFLDFLLYVHTRVISLAREATDSIETLKKYLSEEFYKVLFSKNYDTLIITMKTTVVFSKMDLNENISWSKLIDAKTAMETNEQFVDNILTCCYWSLIWRIRKIHANATQGEDQSHLLRGQDLAKTVEITSNILNQYYSACFEAMESPEINIKLKVFEKLCETILSLCKELENVSRELKIFENLKPSSNNITNLVPEIEKVLEMSVALKEPDDVCRFRKYITYICEMACLEIIPMDCLSMFLKYFDAYYLEYGKIIQTILHKIQSTDETCFAHLVVNTLAEVYKSIIKKRGGIEIKGGEAKALLALSRRFRHSFSAKIIAWKIAGKILTLAVNFVIAKKAYDFFVFVQIFIDHLVNHPKAIEEILASLTQRLSDEEKKNYTVCCFVKQLREAGRAPVEKSTPAKKGLGTTPKAKSAQKPKTTPRSENSKSVSTPKRAEEKPKARRKL